MILQCCGIDFIRLIGIQVPHAFVPVVALIYTNDLGQIQSFQAAKITRFLQRSIGIITSNERSLAPAAASFVSAVEAAF